MIAIDTNVLVRVLVNDDPAQAKRALAVMQSGPVWVSKTVLVETEWVLRYTYGLDSFSVGVALTKLLGVPTVEVEARGAVRSALSWHAVGMDFADALHLASCGGAESFASFDQKLARAATRAGAKPPVIAP